MFKILLAGAAALATAFAANAETYAIQAGHLIVDAALAERGRAKKRRLSASSRAMIASETPWFRT